MGGLDRLNQQTAALAEKKPKAPAEVVAENSVADGEARVFPRSTP